MYMLHDNVGSLGTFIIYLVDTYVKGDVQV